MFRKLTTVIAAGILLGVGAANVASAADMAVKARPVVAPILYNWQGCYIGGNVAGGWSRMDTSLVFTDPAIPANATNTVAVWPGSLGGMWGYRRELRALRFGPHSGMFVLIAPSLVGGVIGVGLYLGLLGIFGVALGTIIRRSAGAIAALVGLILILPALLLTLPAAYHCIFKLGFATYDARAAIHSGSAWKAANFLSRSVSDSHCRM